MIAQEPSITRLDMAFARFLSQRASLDAAQKQAFESLVMSVSCEQNKGHNCIQIEAKDRELLLASGLVALSGQDGGRLPLVLENDRLYLQRYWEYERRLALQIQALATAARHRVENLDALLDCYFPDCMDETDWQREAAKMALQQSFSIITGGPGTGKTTTVVKILALLQQTAQVPLHIALAAPTGKAAMRLQESIGFNKRAVPEPVQPLIPETATTLHRLLGAKPPSPYFRHHAKQPLVYDLVVVDEASMVDLALMSKLIDALKPGARLILLGDKDQLASVESGAVLADLTLALPAHTVELKKSHRFDESIKKLAVAVNLQQSDVAWQILQTGDANIGLLQQDLVDYAAGQQSEYLTTD